MTCSLETYRYRIGSFNLGSTKQRYFRKSNGGAADSGSLIICTSIFILFLLQIGRGLEPPGGQVHCGQGITTIGSRQSWDPGNTKYTCGQTIRHGWDPGGVPQTTVVIPWEDSIQQNKHAHITNGNRGQRGRGIKCIYWNKGPSFLVNKQLDLETILSTHRPHILGLGEANFRRDHNLEDAQLRDYTLHLDSCVDNPDLGLARVAVYTHSSLRVKRRPDLEDNEVAAVWLECGLPSQHSILVCMGYRQWRLPGQQDSTSASVREQVASIS